VARSARFSDRQRGVAAPPRDIWAVTRW
jgi:hypothetical protein